MKLDLDSVIELYESIRIDCSECGRRMIPLGGGMIDPYHYCPDCKIKIPFDDIRPSPTKK